MQLSGQTASRRHGCGPRRGGHGTPKFLQLSGLQRGARPRAYKMTTLTNVEHIVIGLTEQL